MSDKTSLGSPSAPIGNKKTRNQWNPGIKSKKTWTLQSGTQLGSHITTCKSLVTLSVAETLSFLAWKLHRNCTLMETHILSHKSYKYI